MEETVGVVMGTAAGPALPTVVRGAMQRAGQARRDGRVDLAATALRLALDQLRAEPLGAPFLARVQLALVLADTYLELGEREQARRLLLDESGYAERIFHLMRLSGTPEQRRMASTGRLQIRDRAIQVELLGQEAPEIDVADWVLGAPASLSELRGKVVLVEFWATWCRPCLEMFPHLRELHQQYAERGLEVLALTHYGPMPPDGDLDAAWERERDLVRTVVADRDLEIRAGIAPDERLQRRYGATGVPTLALIDRAGRVRLIASGGDDAALEASIRACLDETAAG
jgi:thiol-disulfide isomerase/thioredoxin